MNKTNNTFGQLILELEKIGIKKQWIENIILLESGGNWTIENSIKAYGAIQMLPTTLRWLNETYGINIKKNLSNQRYGILMYYRSLSKGKKLNHFYDAYMLTFYPYAVGKTSDYILGSEKSDSYAKLIGKQNPAYAGLNGYVSINSFRTGVDSRLSKKKS